MTREIFVCLDLGNDTLKISFAYESDSGEIHGKLMLPDLINQVALPAAACYDEDAREWRYAEELEQVNNDHFSTVVKIKSLLSLFTHQSNDEISEKNRMYYREGHYFPKFSFPVRHRMKNDFQYLVDQKLVFDAPKYTPQSMCEGFFKHVKKTVDKCISKLAEQSGEEFAPLEKISIVHPPKQGEEYLEELSRLVSVAFGFAPVKILTSTQALGLLAFHTKILGNGEKTLLFDMGDETVSVAKVWINEIGQNVYMGNDGKKLGILIDSQEAHSAPLDLGGCDIDEEISYHLESRIHDRETVGSPSVGSEGHIFENGICSSQYLLMKDIKKAKMVMPMTVGGIFKDGVPISIHRETLVQRLLTPRDFYSCVGTDVGSGIAQKVSSYILKELSLSVNRDVTKIIFGGGMIETYGLMDYLCRKIHHSYPGVDVITFENERNDRDDFLIQFFEASTYAAAVGGAIVAKNDYSVDAVLSYSYGTWLYHGDYRKHLKLFANRGDLLISDENRFAMEATMDVGRIEQSYLEGDELFSTIINMKELERRAYSDRVTYEGGWLIVGEAGDEDRRRAHDAIDLRVVAGGAGTQINFYYAGQRVALSSSITQALYFEEGFVVDKKGNAKPFFSNLKRKNNVEIRARMLSTNRYMTVNAQDIEFRLQMDSITVATNT